MKKKPHNILHLGDIHIFQNKRHEEYDELIDLVCEMIIRENVDLVYFGGDIVDSKTKLSPEQVMLMKRLVKKVSDLVPSIWILGNHDLNVKNKYRLDSLSPFLENVTSKFPIHFLKRSGIYELYDINWAVWSCLDDQKSPFAEPQAITPTKYVIGCFHGIVDGVKIENGSTLSSDIKIDEFRDCDVVFLNDIHTRCEFKRNDVVFAAYSGPITQTKVNENESNGALLWTLVEDKYVPRFIELPKKFGYRTYEIQDLTTFKLPEDDLPRTYVPRLLYTGDANKFSPTLFEDLKKQLQKKVDTEVIIQVKPSNSRKEIIVKANERVVDFFKTYFEAKECTKEQIKALKQVDEYYNKLVDSSDYKVGQYVIEEVTIHNFMSYGSNNVIRLADIPGITGLFAPNRTGKSTLLDAIMFCFFNKTSRIARPGKELINDQINEEAYVEVIVTLGGSRWRIKRILVPKKDTVSTILEVYEIVKGKEVPRHKESRKDTEPMLRKMLGDAEIFLITALCTQKKPVEFVDCTNAERLDLFLRFLGITVYEQKNELAKKDAEKKFLECELLRKEVEGFANEERIKEEISEFEATIKTKDKTVKEQEREIKTKEKEVEKIREVVEALVVVELGKTLEELSADLKREELTEATSSETIVVEKQKLATAKKEWSEKVPGVKPEDWIEDQSGDQSIIDELSALREKLGSLQLKTSKKTIEEWKEFRKEAQTTVDKLTIEKEQLETDNKDIAASWTEKETIEDWEADPFENNTYNKAITTAELAKKNLQEQLDSDVCPTCKQVRKQVDKQSIKNDIEKQDQIIAKASDSIETNIQKKIKLAALQKTYNTNKTKAASIATRLASSEAVFEGIDSEIAELRKNATIKEERETTLRIIRETEEKLATLRGERAKILALQKKVEQSNTAIELAKAQLELSKSKVDSIKKDIKTLTANKANREKKEKYKLEIEAIEQLIVATRSAKQAEELAIANLQKNIQTHEASIKQFAEKRKELLQKEQEYNNLQLYVQAMHRSGIPLLILQTFIPDVNFEINDNLEGLFDFSVLFELDDKSLDIYFADNSIKHNKRNVALTSGVEGFVINLAIRAALTRISLLPKPSIFMIDEGFSVSDADNLEPLKELLRKFTNQYHNIIMITHLDDLKDFPENFIYLKKEEGITKVFSSE